MPVSSTKRLVVYPYRLSSGSARSIARAFKTICVRPNGTYRPRSGDVIVNWGNSVTPSWWLNWCRENAQLLNKPEHVVVASDKRRTFEKLAQLPGDLLPEWTTNRDTAKQWLTHPIYGRLKNAVVCRTLTRASEGRGIVLASTEAAIVAAPLYTRYKPKTQEFRIHVNAKYGVIDIQEKRKRQGSEKKEEHQFIRSHDHNWVFCREDIQCPDRVIAASIEALAALGLDFGAVDVGWHPDYGMAIYEINTAPGLEGQTLQHYITMFRRYLT